MPSLWFNFYAVVGIQFILFALFAMRGRASIRRVLTILSISFLCGLVLGVMFDFIVGAGNGIFSYYLHEDWKFSLLNGVLSYGAAFATAALFPTSVKTMTSRLPRYIQYIGAALLALDSGALYFVAIPLIQTFMIGAFIVLFSELLCIYMNKRGPVLSLLCLDWKVFLNFWAASIVAGAVYEGANYLFPVWIWDFAGWVPVWQTELLMVLCGYVVLFEVFVVCWQVLLNRKY